MNGNQKCGNCAWYDKPWPGPCHGHCTWLENHLVVLPPWIENASRSMSPSAGKDCGRHDAKDVHLSTLPEIREFGFSSRLKNILSRHSIDTTQKLISRPMFEYLRFRQFGFTTKKELEMKLEEKGLKLKD